MEKAKIKIKKIDLLNLFGAFASLTQKKTPVKMCASRNQNNLTAINDQVAKEMEDKHTEHVMIDNDSNPVFLPKVEAKIKELAEEGKQTAPPQPNWYEYEKKNGLEKYLEEIGILNNEEVEIEIHTVKLSDKRWLIDPKGERAPQELTIEELIEDPNSSVSAELPLLLKHGVLIDIKIFTDELILKKEDE